MSTFWEHQSYDGTTNSPDVTALTTSARFEFVLDFLPRDLADELRTGQPIGTMGFPGEIDVLNTTVPVATFKEGTISALRPYRPDVTPFAATNNRFVQHNLDLSGGTSGSPIFDHQGWVVAVNNSGTEALVINQTTGAPSRVGTGNIGFGIRADDVWDLVDFLSSGQTGSFAKPEGRTFPVRLRARSGPYMPFPANWDGTTIAP